MKKWTVYQVENLVNGRLYIGVHKTEDPDDGYMGSGKLIRLALENQGIENFRKKVLLITESKDEAFALEKELVTTDRIESGELYNLKEGGEGGWDHISFEMRSSTKSRDNKEASKETKSLRSSNSMKSRGIDSIRLMSLKGNKNRSKESRILAMKKAWETRRNKVP